MPKVLILKGLPASGKSTYARELVDRGNWVRVNKDDLRLQLHNSKWSKNKEKIVESARDAIIVTALKAGQNVVVDDTNFSPRHKRRITQVVDEVRHDLHTSIEIEEKFFEIDVEEAIARDAKRRPDIVHKTVGAKIIRSMYNQFLRKRTSPPPAFGEPVIIVDLDGTLALFGNKNPYERDFITDEPNLSVINILHGFYPKYPVIIFSGRSAKYREATELWLRMHNVPCSQLYMRTEGDNRKDSIVKREFYEQHIKGQYNVFAVFDDRLQCARLWYQLGLPLFRVGDPDADF
jgi:predicted kinase